MKKYFKSVSVLLLCIIVVLLISSCYEHVNDAEKPSGAVQFQIANKNVNYFGKGWWQPENVPLKTSVLDPNLLRKSSIAFDEVAVLVLDMTRWESFADFYDAWTSGEQESLFDTSLWNYSKDIWTNISMLLNSYTGDYYEYIGEINLHIENNVAKGSINLNPGLNYFFYALRKDGQTLSWGEAVAIIKEGEKNTVTISQQSYDLPPEVPYDPHPADGTTGVPLNTSLSWRCSDPEGDTLSYYIYLGTTSDPGWENFQSENVYKPTTLLPNTKYYWKIQAYDKSYNSSESPVWSFTTGASRAARIKPGFHN